ncbi:MAG: sensor histidine kinase [Christensenellales bacterium]|jgi:two-component system sensor histidine kinase CiaH
MIRNIRRRFIRIALSVLALAMVLVVGVINTANWINVRAELFETMHVLIEGGGKYGMKGGGRSRHMRNMLEESRFFVVGQEASGEWALQGASRVADMDEEELTRVVSNALASGRETGFSGEYLYSVRRQRGNAVTVFLNCETKLTRVKQLAAISALACGACILLAWLSVALFSRRAIKPLVENMVRQKQFITDAGHELKTPLTVISANMDVLTLEGGDNEWIRSTKGQIANMRALVDELIYLSRLDEEDARLTREELDLSKLVAEAAEPFVAMAEFSGKEMATEVEDDIRVLGDGASLARLVSILCDNAVKYAPDGDEIVLRLKRERKGVELSVENGLARPMDEEVLGHLFDRFYRTDASRSRQSGGYGIGLSIARAVAEKHGGTVWAEQREGGARIRFVCKLRA